MSVEPSPDLQLLPPLLREFVGAIGLDKTMRVVERCAGQRTYFPREPSAEHWLTELIGPADARKLGSLCHGDAVVVPKATAALRELRDRRFVALRDQTSLRHAAKEFGLTRRAAQRVAVRHRQRDGDRGADAPAAESLQPRLFE
jgi:hypothetical protein